MEPQVIVEVQETEDQTNPEYSNSTHSIQGEFFKLKLGN